MKNKKLQKYQKERELLGELESSLIELISETENKVLQDKFLEWQIQGAICNEIYINYFQKLVEK